jgi:hypothetical protein
MKSIRIALAALCAIAGPAVLAQGPDSPPANAFDGTWQFSAAPTADPYCSQFVWRTLAVQQGAMKGTLGHYRGGFNITGQVAPDGKAAFYGDGPFAHLIRGNGQFNGRNGTGSIRLTGPDSFCEVNWKATRQP